MDSMEQKRQGEEGKKEKKNPAKQNQTAHTFTKKGREGESEQWLSADFGQRGHWTRHCAQEMAEDRRTEAPSSTCNPRLKRQLSE